MITCQDLEIGGNITDEHMSKIIHWHRTKNTKQNVQLENKLRMKVT